MTLDTLIAELMHALLKEGLVEWLGAQKTLDVRDTWRSLVKSSYSDRTVVIGLRDGRVTATVTRASERAQRPVPRQMVEKLVDGVCTHDDVRNVLELSLRVESSRNVVRTRLAETVHSLIVDEVFDGNELDLEIVRLAIEAGVSVTLIGDPWQALYRFRGARPDLVPDLVEAAGLATLPLSQSFRWRSAEQADLARALRAGEATVLRRADAVDDLDVVLACEWAHLWDTSPSVLPLAFGAAKGNVAEAGATLLLDYVTRSLLGIRATYADEALATLRIADPEAILRLDAGWPAVIADLRRPGRDGLNAAYVSLVELLRTETDIEFPAVRGNYTNRLGWLRDRIGQTADVVPGLTVHQAKGGEWRTVGLALTESHHAQLQVGLSVSEAVHRQLYVACTRAQHQTLAL